VLVRFFARLREELGVGEKVLELNDRATLGELLAAVFKEGPPEDLLLALNNELVRGDRVDEVRLREGDVIDIMPPASGG